MYNNSLVPVILVLTPFASVYSSTVSTTTMFSTTMSWQARILNSSSSIWIPANTDYEKYFPVLNNQPAADHVPLLPDTAPAWCHIKLRSHLQET